jgi:hypothetical protein
MLKASNQELKTDVQHGSRYLGREVLRWAKYVIMAADAVGDLSTRTQIGTNINC